MKIESRFCGRLAAAKAVSIVFCLVAIQSLANTVLWYRFEEHEPGYVMKSSDRVTNEVDNATLKGQPKTGGSSKWPSYVATPQGLESVYDPVSGKVYSNKSALLFPHVGNDYQYTGSRIETPDDSALHLQTFTIEMFVRRKGPNGEYGRVLVKKFRNDENKSAFNFYRAGGDNFHYFTIVYKKEDGTYASTTSADTKMTGNILNTSNFWDHVAIVADIPNRSCKVYRNYTQLNSYSIPAGDGAVSIDYGTGYPLLIGGDGSHCFSGEIDELRISDTALQPSQFLRLCSPAALPETTHLYTFDCATNFSWNSKMPWRNLAPVMKEASSAAVYNLAYPTVGVDENVSPGVALRSGLLSNFSTANDCSFHTSTNIPATDASAAYIKAAGCTRFYATDFTFEMAFKVPPQPTSATLPGANDNAAWLAFAHTWGIRFIRASGQLHLYYAGTDYNFGRYTDNAWHRLAYVFEKASNEHRFYIDGVQKFAKTSARDANSNDAWYLLGEGNVWGGGQDLSAGWIDDVRVTEKALRPCEFLTSVPKEDGSTLAWYSFENNSLDNGVYTNVIGAGALGGAAAFAKAPGKVKELWDSTGAKTRDNFTSLAVNGGKAVWPRNSLLEREDLTVEFFARQSAASPANAGLVSAMRSASGTNSTAITASDAIWSIRVGSDGRTPEVYVNNGTVQTVAFPSSTALGAWSHYAVSFVPSGDDTDVKLYYDHALVKTETITGKLQLPSTTGGAIPMLGKAGSDGAAFNGSIDEVRVSLGEVAIVDMLYAPPNAGFVLMYK